MAGALFVLGTACSSATPHARPANPPAAASSAPADVSLSAATEAWTLPAAVSRPVVLPDRGGFAVLGGLALGDTSTSRVVQVDPVSGDSRVAGSLAVAVHDSAGAVIDGRFFVFGGGSLTSVPIVQAWTAGVATQVASLPEARSDVSAATLGGTTYIVGGYDGSAMTPDILATTDGQSFRPVARLAIPVRYAAVAGLGNTLWVMGGVTSTSEGGTTDTDAVQKVDLASGQVTVAGRLPQPMGHATALTLDDQIFVLGGRSGTVPSSTIFRLDPASAVVIAAGRLPQAVSDAGSVVVGDVGYLVGGEITGPAEPLDTVVALRPSLPPGS
jgi:N-acetylneuraminic acid mutarotase